MRRLMLVLCGFFFCLGLFPVRAGELPSVLTMKDIGYLPLAFEWLDCTITDVRVYDESMMVCFKKESRPSGDAVSSSAEYAFTVSKKPDVSPRAFEALGRRFSKQEGQRVNITVTTGSGYMIRGGVLLLTFPDDQFEITPVDESMKPAVAISKTALVLPEFMGYHGGTFYQRMR